MRPIRLMEDVSRDYPGVWSHYDRMLAAREELGGWPLWCFCPLAAAYAVVSGRWGEPVPLAHSRDIARVGALQAQLAGQRLHLPTGAVESLAEDISPLISVLLYLCSDDPELRPTRGAKRAGTFPALKPGREGPRMPPADRPEVWETGFRLGEALRLARESEELSEGASVRGHIRRAHWHSYWIGPRKEPGKPGQKRIIRWLPPIPVNLEAVPERPTVRSVH